MLSWSCLAKKCIKGVIAITNGLVAGHLSIRLDAMLQAVQLPASVTDLASGLANMNGNTLTLHKKCTGSQLNFQRVVSSRAITKTDREIIFLYKLLTGLKITVCNYKHFSFFISWKFLFSPFLGVFSIQLQISRLKENWMFFFGMNSNQHQSGILSAVEIFTIKSPWL